MGIYDHHDMGWKSEADSAVQEQMVKWRFLIVFLDDLTFEEDPFDISIEQPSFKHSSRCVSSILDSIRIEIFPNQIS